MQIDYLAARIDAQIAALESERAVWETEKVKVVQTAKSLKGAMATIFKLDAELSAAQAVLAAAQD